MPRLLRYSERIGCGATIQINDSEVCIVSVAAGGVLVKGYRPTFAGVLLSFLGPVLFREDDKETVRKIMKQLPTLYEPSIVPVQFDNLTLSAFSNAVWRCLSWTEVIASLNAARQKAEALQRMS